MNKILKNQNGATMVGTLIMVVLMAYIGASIVEITNTDTSSTTNEAQTFQALQIGNGGLQYALDKINQGESPDVIDQELGNGLFTITTDPTTQNVTVVASVGVANKTQQLTTNFSEQVILEDATPTSYKTKALKNLEITKTGNDKVILDKIQVEWNWGLCVQNISCTATGVPGTGSTGKTTICHYPPGNPANRHTISVGTSAVDTHIDNHGDTIGTCPGDPGSSYVVCEDIETSVAACSDDTGGALVKSIKINGSWVILNANAASGDIINVTDTTFTADQAYVVDEINFTSNIPDNVWFKVTLIFKDNSTVSKDFKFSPP